MSRIVALFFDRNVVWFLVHAPLIVILLVNSLGYGIFFVPALFESSDGYPMQNRTRTLPIITEILDRDRLVSDRGKKSGLGVGNLTGIGKNTRIVARDA